MTIAEVLRLKPGMSLRVAARIARLNPTPERGRRLRGWQFYERVATQSCLYGSMSRGNFLRRYGRAIADQIPKVMTYRRGKRQFFTHQALTLADQMKRSAHV